MENTEYVTRYTTAPADYDYGYVRVVNPNEATDTSDGKTYRRVEFPASKARHQEGRYWSGLHRPWTPSEFAEKIDYGQVKIG